MKMNNKYITYDFRLNLLWAIGLNKWYSVNVFSLDADVYNLQNIPEVIPLRAEASHLMNSNRSNCHARIGTCSDINIIAPRYRNTPSNSWFLTRIFLCFDVFVTTHAVYMRYFRFGLFCRTRPLEKLPVPHPTLFSLHVTRYPGMYSKYSTHLPLGKPSWHLMAT